MPASARTSECTATLQLAAYPMRRPRLDLPGIPQHLTHRGVNRAAVFLDEDDYDAYLHVLDRCARDQDVHIHSYVLMSNHVHLLVSTLVAGAVSRMMQAIGRRYVRTLNTKYARTGTLWEGRYKSCLVDIDRYLLTCLRYIELNPLRAAMVERPEDYRWSSVHHHLNLGFDDRITVHPGYLALGRDPLERAGAYRKILADGINDIDLAVLRKHLQQERALGSPRFQAMVEKTLNRPATVRSVGRPRKKPVDSNGYVL